MEKKKIEEEKEKKGKKKWLLLLLFLLLFVFVSIGTTYSINEGFKNSVDETIINTFRIDTPTAPVIGGSSGKWSKKEVVKIIKDAKSYNGIAYYEYCMLESKDFSKCDWKKTETKNMVASTTGKYYVVFRGVSKNGKTGKNSNIEEVLIDNEGPTVSKLEITNLKNNKVEVYVEAKDNYSGIGNYYYKIDDGEYKKVEKTFNIDNLEEKEYTITIRVEDKLGNYKEVSKVFLYNNEICKLNCDTNGDGKADLNIDTNGDGKADLNIDTDGDGKADINIDTDGDGVCDLNCEDGEGNTDGSQTPNDNPNSVNPTPSETPRPTSSPEITPTPTEEPTLGDEDIIPEINLDKVPLEFSYGEKYELPSYVDFKGELGTVSCIVEGEEYKDTSKLKAGKHLIVCTATTSKNVKVTVEKEVKVTVEKGLDEEWEGWIRMNLYFPEGSTDWQWRLGREGEIRTGYNDDGWQDYTGPILVRLRDVENVYIKYKVNGVEQIIPPKGVVLVDIQPENYTVTANGKTKVSIVYDRKATTKQYKINGGAWQDYIGPFEVGANTLIEAQASYSEKVYTVDGEFAYTAQRIGTDSVFISEYLNAGSSSSGTIGGGYGGSISYGPTFGSGGWITSPSSGSYKSSAYLEGPIITSNPTTLAESVDITVSPQQRAETIYIKIGNGKYQEYKAPVNVTTNGWVSAYYIRKSDGMRSKTTYYYVDNIKVPNLPYVKISANPGTYLTDNIEEVEVTISGSDYDTLEYSYDGKIYTTYQGPLKIRDSKTIYARGKNANGQTVESLTVTTTTPPLVKDNYDVSIQVSPTDVKGLINEVEVEIDYDKRATDK